MVLIKSMNYSGFLIVYFIMHTFVCFEKKRRERKVKSSPDSCVKCYTMFLQFLLIKIDVFS